MYRSLKSYLFSIDEFDKGGAAEQLRGPGQSPSANGQVRRENIGEILLSKRREEISQVEMFNPNL